MIDFRTVPVILAGGPGKPGYLFLFFGAEDIPIVVIGGNIEEGTAACFAWLSKRNPVQLRHVAGSAYRWDVRRLTRSELGVIGDRYCQECEAEIPYHSRLCEECWRAQEDSR